MEATLDPESGELRIKDGYTCFMRPDTDGRLIALYAIFKTQPSAMQSDKLEYVNRVNDKVKLIRASVMADGRYYFDYYLAVDGGITKKAIVLATRRFLGTLETAMTEDTGNVVG
jgi:hypothetical protein